ncbi:MAG: Glutamate-1-semialdehyde 2,1-aminomutase [uncultured Thermomicrobiales bacterium]|uniref:Glutamate-1-semialdehyde 2,1-aminomutase n=1 Tax=uncultured Thermomicrobiales bacterium TaxID=1645740 RepID=A0A6J4UXM9_9BACT|nr:MAG: Glutamate-1-semialdehyde 2,1-aminomutase [uncultured Thermomicrobiales bacterium]
MAVQIVSPVRTEMEADVLAAYRARTPISAALHEEASVVMPGGDTRTVAFHAPYPLAVEHGQGSVLRDADGNEYLDLLNNYTSLIHGHAHPAITRAVTAQLRFGTAFPAPNRSQTRLATIVTERVASVDLIRFCNSGTEAVMNALRAARAFTGRDLVVKIEGGYHGTYDDVEVSVHPDPAADAVGSDEAPLPVVDTLGVPANTVEAVAVIPFNDIAAAERVFRERGDQIAAVIVEPVMGASGMIPADHHFLEALRALTVESGALLIFDEVMSFRLMPGGMQEHYRVRPDLTTFAKIIGGGFPVGAFGGRAAVMEQFNPHRPAPLWQSGTFNGNLATMVAGVAAMEAYPASEVVRINRLGDRLRSGLTAALNDAGVVGAVTGFGSFVGLHLGVQSVRSYRDGAAVDKGLARLLHLALLLEGVACAPRLMWCTSTAMDEATIDDVLARARRALAAVAPALPARRGAMAAVR